MKSVTNFSKYQGLRHWSDLPITDYRIVRPDGTGYYANERFAKRAAAWNLYWAIANRVDPESEDLPVLLEQLALPAENRILTVPSMRIQVESGSVWTLAALMCKHEPKEFMLRYWPLVRSKLKLPQSYAHVFTG